MASITSAFICLLLGASQVTAQTTPAEFQPNPTVGDGGNQYKDSPHFRVYNASTSQTDAGIKMLEAAYTCFVGTLGWRTTGLSFKSDNDNGPYYKENIYAVGSLGTNVAGQQWTDQKSGFSYLKVVSKYLTDPSITVHEYGHALTYSERYWVDEKRTGAWWETVANHMADTFMTSPLCAAARTQYGQAEGRTMIDLNKVISDSYQVIVDGTSGTGNYYQAWPFLTYLITNPDNYTSLGPTTIRNMIRKHKRGSNETPLHDLQTIASPISVQKIVGRYWARMAYLDIGHPKAQQEFMSSRSSLNYANVASAGNGIYKVKDNRQPRYMGANILPLKGSGAITVNVTANMPFTATLAVRSKNGAVQYVDLQGGKGQATIENGGEVSLVIVNTPDALILYDPFSLTADVNRGLSYQVQLSGATV